MKISPIELISEIPADIDGSNGLNRSPSPPDDPCVTNDLEAIKRFLSVHSSPETTHRNYTKEAERILLWALIKKQKPLSSLNSDDISEYLKFMESPFPVDVWCSGVKKRRDSKEWRPFVSGLRSSSILTAYATLSAMFTWLVDYGYLLKNPVRVLKKARKELKSKEVAESGGTTSQRKVERFLDETAWAAFIEAIEAMPKNTAEQEEAYERARFLAAMMYFLAPRAGELETHRMNSFHQDSIDQRMWWWRVKGKGGKVEDVPVVDGMLSALIRYRTWLGLIPLPSRDDDTPLLRAIGSGNPMTARRLNYILKDLFNKAADLLTDRADEMPAQSLDRANLLIKAADLRKASAHWGRHTSITNQVRSGIDLMTVRSNARHSDSRTTMLYVHEDSHARHDATQKLK